MNWKLPIVGNRCAFPRGMERKGAAGPRSMCSTARQGRLVISGYDISPAMA